MKKITKKLLMSVIVITLAACGGGDDNNNGENGGGPGGELRPGTASISGNSVDNLDSNNLNNAFIVKDEEGFYLAISDIPVNCDRVRETLESNSDLVRNIDNDIEVVPSQIVSLYSSEPLAENDYIDGDFSFANLEFFPGREYNTDFETHEASASSITVSSIADGTASGNFSITLASGEISGNFNASICDVESIIPEDDNESETVTCDLDADPNGAVEININDFDNINFDSLMYVRTLRIIETGTKILQTTLLLEDCSEDSIKYMAINTLNTPELEANDPNYESAQSSFLFAPDLFVDDLFFGFVVSDRATLDTENINDQIAEGRFNTIIDHDNDPNTAEKQVSGRFRASRVLAQ